MSPSPADLTRLAEKYRTLGDLRRARERGEPVPKPAVFKLLARAFPGALAELDTLPLQTIDARASSLEGAALGAAIEPWMIYLHGYHALMRAALLLKPRVGRDDLADDERATALANEASARSGARVDASFVRAVAHPPRGRLVALVFERLSLEHGDAAATIKEAIFPKNRR